MHGRTPTSTIRFAIEKVGRRILIAVLIVKKHFLTSKHFEARPPTPLPYEAAHILPLEQRGYAPDANGIPNDNILLFGRFRPEFGRAVGSASLGDLIVRRINRLVP